MCVLPYRKEFEIIKISFPIRKLKDLQLNQIINDCLI